MTEAIALEGAGLAVETDESFSRSRGSKADASDRNARCLGKSLEPGRFGDWRGAEDLIIVTAAQECVQQVWIGAESGAGGN